MLPNCSICGKSNTTAGETTVKPRIPTATLRIKSQPEGAKVYINGTYKGMTPLILELEPRTYSIKLSKDRYENYTTTIEVGANEPEDYSPSSKGNQPRLQTTNTTINTLITTTTATMTSKKGRICGSVAIVGFVIIPLLFWESDESSLFDIYLNFRSLFSTVV